MKKSIISILLTSSLAYGTIFCVFTFFIPRCVNNSYDVINEKIIAEENVVLSSTRSITKGVKEITNDLDFEVDPTLIVVSEIKQVDKKIIGVIRNNSESNIQHVSATVVTTDKNGVLKDVISETLKGFGTLKPKAKGYFYTEDVELNREADDSINMNIISVYKPIIDTSKIKVESVPSK
jgi:hypothetical protein